MTRNMLGGPFCQLCSILRERTLPFRSDRRSRLRARLPERVLQRKCLDQHTGIEDPLRHRHSILALVDCCSLPV